MGETMSLFDEIEHIEDLKAGVVEEEEEQQLLQHPSRAKFCAEGTLADEVMTIFSDTFGHPLEQRCYISFITFVLANYSKAYILAKFPHLAEEYRKLLTEGELND
jgi:hypothetical protein